MWDSRPGALPALFSSRLSHVLRGLPRKTRPWDECALSPCYPLLYGKAVASVQGSARKTGPWDEQEAKALTQEVQRYMELKQGARAQRAAVAGQVLRSVFCLMWQLNLGYVELKQGARAQWAAVAVTFAVSCSGRGNLTCDAGR